jgi:hypothetical protein
MGCRFISTLLCLVLFLSGTKFIPRVFASTPTPTPTATPEPTPYDGLGVAVKDDPNGLLHFDKKSGADVETIRMIDAQSRVTDSGSRSVTALEDNIAIGHQRAIDMTMTLKNQEFQKALVQVTPKGKQLLQENPELQNPLTIIGGAVSLWAGYTVKLIKNENFKLATYIKGQDHAGEFQMESPLMNGKLQFNEIDGVALNVNRSISSIDSAASFNYSARAGTMGGALSHTLLPHVNLSVGTTQYNFTNQLDENARIDFQLDF